MAESLTRKRFIFHKRSRLRTGVRRLLRMSGLIMVVLALLVTVVTVTYRFINPPGSTLMLARTLTGKKVGHQWVPLNRISPNLVKAVIAAEDGRFCRHRGVDWNEVSRAIKKARNGYVRGASTISMQTAKNLYLWPQKSYVRKAVEIPLTFLMEALWSKRRMLEIYLNIVEWGPGIFGAEVASRYHFNKSARYLTPNEASLLAAALPNPILRRAGRPGPKTARHSTRIANRVAKAPPATSCIYRKKELAGNTGKPRKKRL